MKKTDYKVWIIIILAIAVVILSYMAFKTEPQPTDSKYIKEQIQALKMANDSLMKNVTILEKQNVISQNTIDSLQKVKSKIQIKYVNKYKEIDNADASDIINEFDDIFTTNNIK